MKRNFYLVMTVVRRKLNHLDEKEIVHTLFPQSDVKSHLADKLYTYHASQTLSMLVYALLDFYESLDDEHQYWFDQWFNAEIEKLNANTTQHSPMVNIAIREVVKQITDHGGEHF